MSHDRRLKSSEKIKALQAFINDESNNEIDYSVESFQRAVKDFLALEHIDKVEDNLPSLIDNFIGHYQGTQKVKEVDFSKTTNSDWIDEALQPIRGVMTILSSMALSTRGADEQFQSQSYDVLHDTCNGVLEKFEELKPQIDYMEDVIRGNA